MKPDLSSLKQEVSQLPESSDRRHLLSLIAKTAESDRVYDAMTDEDKKKQAKLRRNAFFALLIFLISIAAALWLLHTRLSLGWFTTKSRTISANIEPFEFWFNIFLLAGAIVLLTVLVVYIIKFLFAKRPNPAVQRTLRDKAAHRR